MKLHGCKIVLTGASSGIGRELLEQLLKYDVSILAVDLNTDNLPDNPQVFPYCCDISEPQNLDKLFSTARNLIGGIDLFIANAGFAYYEKLCRPDWEHMERIYKTNVFSPLYCLEKLQELHPDGNYKMVITASAMGKLAMPGYALYSSTKAALDSFAAAYRFELTGHQLCMVYPIATSTNFFAAAGRGTPVPWPAQSPDRVARAIIRGIQNDRTSVYPSRLFLMMMFLNRLLPFIFPLYLRSNHKKFITFLSEKT